MTGCLSQASTNRKRVENIAKRKLDSLMKESKIRDCEDPSDFPSSAIISDFELNRVTTLHHHRNQKTAVEHGLISWHLPFF